MGYRQLVSARTRCAFGTLDEWHYMVPTHVLTQGRVYVDRMQIAGAELKTPREALMLVAAVGQGQNLGLDVRAIALTMTAPGAWLADVVMTSPGVHAAYLLDDNGTDIGKHVEQDPDLHAYFPKLVVPNSVFGELTEPKAAVAHWLAQAVLWDHNLTTARKGGHGGPSDAFATPPEYAVVMGTAEDGGLSKPWRVDQPKLVPPEPPRPGGNGKGPGGQGGNTVFWVVGLLALGAGAAYMYEGNKRGRR